MPKIVRRAEPRDGFFVVPLAAGGLDFAKAAEVDEQSSLGAKSRRLEHAQGSGVSDFAGPCGRDCQPRADPAHRGDPPASSARTSRFSVGLFVRRPPPFRAGHGAGPRLVGPLCRQGGGAGDVARHVFFQPLSASPRRSANMRRDARSKLLGCRPCPPRRRSAALSLRRAACACRGGRSRRAAPIRSGRSRSRRRIRDSRRR